MKQNLYITIIVFLLLSSCCKDRNPYKEGCQEPLRRSLGFLSRQCKTLPLFKPGSWWVYENVAIKNVDIDNRFPGEKEIIQTWL